ncbi:MULTISPECIES: tetratricopeptide repeat protein [unclassified Bradyrhizobium]|uniref:tetratricopeptide repeat protein n=1 Tax=unclassified Bradyrhizobium TaxID=2631580 RepID=UPI002916B842|nr:MULTISPECIES: tetratricopeptide repeat protein [unclassified Bradyrhizobium]
MQGLVLFKRGNYSGAAAQFRLALNRCPSCKVIRSNLAHAEARASFKRGNYAGAVAKLKQAIAVNPSDRGRANVRAEASVVLNLEGVALWDRGDIAGAIAKFKEAIAFNPSNNKARGNLAHAEGYILFKRDDYAGAIAKWKQAIAVNPSDKGARSYLATAQENVRKQRETQKQDEADQQARARAGATGGTGGTRFFGTQPAPTNPDLWPSGPNRTTPVSSAIEQLRSMVESGKKATDSMREAARGGAECGFGTKPCEPPGQVPDFGSPQPSPALSPAASALIARLAKNKQVMEDPKIRTYLNWYLSLDQQGKDTQARLAAIQKEIDSGKGDRPRQILDAIKGTQENNLKDIEANKAKAEAWMKGYVQKDLGLTWPEEASPPPPLGAATNSDATEGSGATRPSVGAPPGPGAQQ